MHNKNWAEEFLKDFVESVGKANKELENEPAKFKNGEGVEDVPAGNDDALDPQKT